MEVSLLCKGCAGDVGQWMGRKSTKPQCGDGQIASMIHDMFMEGEQRGCVCVWGGGGWDGWWLCLCVHVAARSISVLCNFFSFLVGYCGVLYFCIFINLGSVLLLHHRRKC